jgi:hypothetical protein
MRRYNVPKARDSNKPVRIAKYRRRKKRTAKSIPALSGVNAVNATNSGPLTEVNFGFSIWYEASSRLPHATAQIERSLDVFILNIATKGNPR